jgi:alkanesulfonate monooxygenase SsuD/methylene tetrahydromethanopterin reductase-like flavin-dependent oxidoreductase (luciferase family)
MQAWYHCENTYPFVPQEVLDAADSVRASLPNKYCDPKIAAQLFEECLDEHLYCDELGINIVSIEHHSGINSLYGASPMILGIAARQTKNVRILSLGTLISVRQDPVRIAEEYATADVISRGRLEIGFVKSGDSEMVSGNANPVGYVDRFWEAIDVIKLALTAQDGPVSWEGKHYTHRHINIWPGPIRSRTRNSGRRPATPRPRPKSAGAAISTRWCCAGRKRASARSTPIRTRGARPGYRRPAPTNSPMRCCAASATPTRKASRSAPRRCGSSTPASSRRRRCRNSCPAATRLSWRPTSGARRGRAAGPADGLIGITAETAIQRGILVAGNPDTVAKQIMDIYDKVDGFAHLIFIGRSGFLTHEEAKKTIRLMAKEVLPRLPAATDHPRQRAAGRRVARRPR